MSTAISCNSLLLLCSSRLTHQEEEHRCEDALLATSHQAICCTFKHAGNLQAALGCDAKSLKVLHQLVGQHATKLGGAEVCRTKTRCRTHTVRHMGL